jgi:hypothetical protein
MSWSETLSVCFEKGIRVVWKNASSSNVYKVRNGCLGGIRGGGKGQKLWQGKLAYDYLMWLDSDQVWSAKDFLMLHQYMETHSDCQVVTGLYRQHEDNDNYLVQLLGKECFLSKKDLKDFPEVMEVGSAGLGFCLMRQGVMEKLDYPWFRPVGLQFDNGQDFTGEDAGLFIRLAHAGVHFYAHTCCVVGHEKSTVLR